MQAIRFMRDMVTSLMSETKDEAYNLIEEVALNNYQWSNERG